MNKQLFIQSIEAIKSQYQTDEKFAYHMAEIFPNTEAGTLMPDNHEIVNNLIQILQEETGDKYINSIGMTWIEFFINELNFGKNNKPGVVNIIGSKKYNLSTPEELYDFLISLQTNTAN